MRFASGNRLGPYEIVAPLGEGGMGEVYRAVDKRLARPVAIKILSARLTENRRALSRFEREARSIAALTHPNILSIFEFDVEGSIPFVVSELLEGVTLRQRMARRIPWRQAAELGAAIADGLAAAHARGITHRDLKPENVFITYDGRVKILDFGIAHVKEGAGEAQRAPSDTEPTAEYRADAPLGTVGYVSPEQIRMKEPEPTSDIFSLGVILHEMIAGANPFARGTVTETLAAILNDEPEPLRTRAEVPETLEHLVTRCLEKNPEQRAQSARDLADQLREAVRRRDTAGPRRRIVRAAAATVTLVAAFAALLYLNGRNGFMPKGASATQAVTTIAILPLVNATGDPKLDYLSDGITESLINQLSELPNLRVTARTTVFQFKGEETDPLDVGKQLAVGAIATGKVALQGETVQIQADLIDTVTGAQLWGDSFDAPRSRASALPGRLARGIARQLEQKLTRTQRARIAMAPTLDSIAFDLYLRGRQGLNSETAKGREQAIALLKGAIDADPRFARAHAALGEAYVRYSTTAEPELMFRRARESVSIALRIDPDLAEAHLSMGVVLLWADWNFRAAQREIQRALELNPSLAPANAYYSDLLQYLGDFDGAIREARRSRVLDPLSRGSAISLAGAYVYAGRFDEALAELTELLRMNPDYANAHAMMGRIFQLRGEGSKACAAYVRWDELRGVPAPEMEARRSGCSRAGIDGYNREVIRAMLADPRSDPVSIGGLYAELGESQAALSWLRRGLEQHATNMIMIRSDPAFAALRSDPEFISIVQEIGFPPESGRIAAGGAD